MSRSTLKPVLVRMHGSRVDLELKALHREGIEADEPTHGVIRAWAPLARVTKVLDRHGRPGDTARKNTRATTPKIYAVTYGRSTRLHGHETRGRLNVVGPFTWKGALAVAKRLSYDYAVQVNVRKEGAGRSSSRVLAAFITGRRIKPGRGAMHPDYPAKHAAADRKKRPWAHYPGERALDVTGRVRNGRRRNSALKPSEHERGKSHHDADFLAGWKAGKAAVKRRGAWNVTSTDARAAQTRVGAKHGTWYQDAYSAAVDDARGVYNGKYVDTARALGLV